MAATNFKTGNDTFRKLIGNGLTYRIPRIQERQGARQPRLVVFDSDGNGHGIISG